MCYIPNTHQWNAPLTHELQILQMDIARFLALFVALHLCDRILEVLPKSRVRQSNPRKQKHQLGQPGQVGEPWLRWKHLEVKMRQKFMPKCPKYLDVTLLVTMPTPEARCKPWTCASHCCIFGVYHLLYKSGMSCKATLQSSKHANGDYTHPITLTLMMRA